MGTLLSTDRLAQLQARLDRKLATLETLYDTYDELASRYNEEYRIDTEDGTMQKARIQNLNKIQNNIDLIERQIDSIQRKMNGTGVVNMTLRRN